jgi:hypothetical protein
MQIAINHQFINDDIFSTFVNFLKGIINNYKYKNQSNYIDRELEKRINRIMNNIELLNSNIELLNSIPNFDELEDELINMKFFLENKLNEFPKEFQEPLNKLYEALSLFIFNLSMYEMNNELKNYRNEKI